MSLSPLDSALTRDLFTDAEIARLFSDTAQVRAMMLVLGALARVQGERGMIPAESGAFLHRAMREMQVDPAGLAEGTARDGVSVPALVTALTRALDAPEHAACLHRGATSQDIQDTALMLRLRQALKLIETRLAAALGALADLAEAHAETPMAARSYGQVAEATSFGHLAATWGAPLLRAAEALPGLRARSLCVSLSGPVGTGSGLGPDPDGLRADLAAELGLGDPGASWHTDRAALHALLGWCVALTHGGGKMGEDLLLLSRSDVAEVTLPGGGGSSSLPQKRNPVAASVLVALSRHAPVQLSLLQANPHKEARDGAAWFLEWLAVPGIVAASARAVALMEAQAAGMNVQRDAMRARLETPLGLHHAAALRRHLEAHGQGGGAAAQADIAALAQEARETETALPALFAARFADLPHPDLSPETQIADAARAARRFAAALRAVAEEKDGAQKV